MGYEVEWRPDPDNVYLHGGRDNLALHGAQERRSVKPSHARAIGSTTSGLRWLGPRMSTPGRGTWRRTVSR